MKARNGKVARLPLEIREQLNHRLADGEPGNRLVEWLNSNAEVMRVMAEHFEGRPITEQNISEWRAGGYEEWVTLHDFLDETRVISENAGEIAATGISTERLHIVLLAHHAYLLQNLGILPDDEFDRRLKAVTKLTASIVKMQRSEQNEVRLQLQRERLELQREIQSLKSSSSSKAAASTSGAARPAASETHQPAQPRVSPSDPSIATSTDPRGADAASAAPPLAAPPAEPAPTVSPVSSRIHPDSPLSGLRFPVSHDSVRLTSDNPSQLAA